MTAKFSATCIAAVLAFGVSVFAQSTGQQPTQSSQPAAGANADQQVTITGCVVRESDYRQAKNEGRGGVAGTGVGSGNEFVLTDASFGSSSAASSRPEEQATPTGTSGASSEKPAYELTGSKEGDLSQYVGRRVELTGKLKAGEKDESGHPTGGATAGAPPSGVDVASKDLKLPEFEVSSVREASGTCSPIK